MVTKKNIGLDFLELELQIWLVEGAQTTIFDSYQLKKEQFCHPKQEAFFLPLHFLHRAYFLLAFFSARSHSEAGLKLGFGVLDVTGHLLDFFLSKSSCLWSVCVHFFSVAPKKNKNNVKKLGFL